jgi:hypothetical protein
MTRNDRRGDEEPGGIGTMTRSRPGPGPRTHQDQAPAVPPAGAEVAAPAPRSGRQGRGRQAREVPPQRPADGQRPAAGRQASQVRRPSPGPHAADPYAAGPGAAADRRGARQPAPRRPDQPGADPRTRTPRNAAVFERQGAPARTVPRPPIQPGQPGRPDQPGQRDQAKRAAQEAVPEAAVAQSVLGVHRMPFVLLLCGLLGGALVSALVISTTLAAGSFRITRLQESTSALARQRQALEQQVAQAKSAEVIAERASKLGMREVGLIQFIDLKTGKTLNDKASGWLAQVHYPGYTP